MSRRTLWLAGVVLGLSILHHVTPESWSATHEVLKRASICRSIFAAVRGGSGLAFFVPARSVTAYVPHFAWPTHAWIVPRASHVADMALLPAVGLVTGVFSQRMSGLRSRNEQTCSELARRQAQVDRFISAEADAERHVTLGRVAAELIPNLSYSCNAACEALLAARGAGRESNQRDYELGVALREISQIIGTVDACRALISAQGASEVTDTADTVRLAAQLARGA